MKQLLLAGTAVLGLAALGLAARATPIDFTYTGSLVDFTVPATGSYQILALGGHGGSGFLEEVPFVPLVIGPGGKGAEIGGNFILTAGEVLQIAVGGAGGDGLISGGESFSGGGGGGGSFVVGPDNTPMIIAGGGGGGGVLSGPLPLGQQGLPGQGGLTGADGGNGGGCIANSGTNGNGGGVGMFGGLCQTNGSSGGGGWIFERWRRQ